MRPLWFDFDADPRTHHVEDQYLFGDEILVAPITTYRCREREVYLPAGATWIDAWSGAEAPGGQVVTAEAPLERIPVFLKGPQPSVAAETFRDLYDE